MMAAVLTAAQIRLDLNTGLDAPVVGMWFDIAVERGCGGNMLASVLDADR